MTDNYIYYLKSTLKDKLIKNLKNDEDFKDLNIDDLIERRVNIILNGDNFEDMLGSTPKQKKSNIIKKDKADKANKPIDPDKCQCRVWNYGWGGQCSKDKSDGDFCILHLTEVKRLCGIITEPRPDNRPDNGIAHGWKDIKDKREIIIV